MKTDKAHSFIAATILLAILSGTAGYLLCTGEYLFAAVIALSALITGVSAAAWHRYELDKIAFMFNAVENDDFGFRFVENRSLESEKRFNASLNRIKEILAQAKKEAVEQEKYYELILESIDSGVAVVDGDGRIYQVNSAALKLFGIEQLTHLKQLEFLDKTFSRNLLTARPGDHLQCPVNNERGLINLSARVSSVKVKDKILRILAFSDIKGELDEKEIESWVRLIRVLTHEIMNGITPITSLSDTLADLAGEKDSDLRAGLQTISSTGKALMSFVESYRRFTRIPTPQMDTFYLAPFLERTAQSGSSATGIEQGLCISVDTEPKDLMLYGDENLLSQVLVNLVKNAVDALAGTPDGQISVRAREDAEQRIIVTVTDNGPGIPPEVAEQIFVPFFTTKEGGSGIGLSLSRQIIRLHGGSLRLKPSPSGAVFEITL